MAEKCRECDCFMVQENMICPGCDEIDGSCDCSPETGDCAREAEALEDGTSQWSKVG